jgi:hypothetical protein
MCAACLSVYLPTVRGQGDDAPAWRRTKLSPGPSVRSSASVYSRRSCCPRLAAFRKLSCSAGSAGDTSASASIFSGCLLHGRRTNDFPHEHRTKNPPHEQVARRSRRERRIQTTWGAPLRCRECSSCEHPGGALRCWVLPPCCGSGSGIVNILKWLREDPAAVPYSGRSISGTSHSRLAGCIDSQKSCPADAARGPKPFPALM